MFGIDRMARMLRLLGLALVAQTVVPVGPALAQDAINPALLEEIQGSWVSRFDDNDTEIIIEGREVRVVRAKPSRSLGYTPAPGDLVVIITSGTVDQQIKSLIEGLPDRKTYRIRSRCVSNHGNTWRMTDNPDCSGYLSANTYFVRGSGGVDRPAFEYRTLSLSGLLHGNGEFWRPEVKRRIFGPPPPAAAEPPRPRTTPSTAPAPSAGTAAAPTPPEDTLSIPVTSEQEQREVAERERLNREQADFGTRQLAENEANRRAFEQALRDREATIAKQKADYEAQLAAVEAERLRREREYAAKMAQWRADVEACKNGDKSKCGK